MLTDRELEVLLRRAKGESQIEIARALKITQSSVSQFESSAHKKILDAEQVLEYCKEAKVVTRKTPTGKKVKYGGRKK